jgi:hypothetical protein
MQRCITASGSNCHQLLAALKKRRKSPNLLPSKQQERPLPQKGAPLSLKGRAPFIKRCSLFIRARPFPQRRSPNLPAPFHLSKPSPTCLPATSADSSPPRSQRSLFEFGNRLNCEEICIQKFSCSSGGRGHSVLACLMG